MTDKEQGDVRQLYHLECDTKARKAKIFNIIEYSEEYVQWLESQVSEYINVRVNKMRRK